jgi:fructose transport system ATP-binding protein
MDQEGQDMNGASPAIEARGLVKHFGHVVALGGVDFDLNPGEVLAVIGDNGAGKSTLIKCLSGAIAPDAGEIFVEGEPVQLANPLEARAFGIETVYQSLALSPALDIADNLFLGRERRLPGLQGKLLRRLDKVGMRREASQRMADLGIVTVQTLSQRVETLSGGQRQGVAVARAAAFGSRVVVMDEPTAALGVREAGQVLQLIRDVRDRGLPVILISHNMPQVFEVADRIHIQRLGRRIAVVTPETHSMSDVVAIMTGAVSPDLAGGTSPP